ncbi:unnamed protein product [Acanthoscelides obtectus]|uniref:Uncharacterized protein n=1 Tax=Acanthoscelides obtectus TaxID=200917 RepID=A0A9P0PXX6_ACAOB|nr:unnamed protein product [Acanthoscelides obtectus]CAK1669444.1 hypothetical protein AOBTE_LOCUS27011 [Acanthoscelides obtectus]
MGEKQHSVYLSQLKAMLKRNILLKKREKRKTTAEVLLPLYSLSILIIMKLVLPNPNLPEIDTPRGEAELLEHFRMLNNHTIAIVPNTTQTMEFLRKVTSLWDSINNGRNISMITWVPFETEKDLLRAYWMNPESIPIAVLFDDPGPIEGQLKYEIRTNPSLYATPPTTSLYSSELACRSTAKEWYTFTGVLPAIEGGDSCPVNQYYFSGFLALQALLDYTKIRLPRRPKV